MIWIDPRRTRLRLSPWVTGLIVALLTAWQAWPLWDSLSAPDRTATEQVFPALLAGLTGLLALLIWAVWHDARRRPQVFAPIAVAVALTVAVRLWLHPNTAGVEPAFALPLLAGAALGGPAGFLTGALANLLTAVCTGTVTTPLIGQTLAWGLWGIAGGAMVKLRRVPAWLLGVALCVPLGLISGLVLNLIGWVDTESFMPGLGPWQTAARLWDYTASTSRALDATRGLSAAVLTFISLPLLRAWRDAAGTEPPTIPPAQAPPPGVSPEALARRDKTTATLWLERTP